MSSSTPRSTTRAAVLRESDEWWCIRELELDEPRSGEVRLKMMAAGLCHSDDHLRSRGSGMRRPFVGGHEGAAIVEAVGPNVTRIAAGDHVACSFIPVCGTCRYCSTGRQNFCDAGSNTQVGCLMDGTYRFHADGEDYGGFCGLGTFSQYTVVSEWSCVKIEPDVPFEIAALVSCGVTTGWGTAVYVANVRPGDTVVVFGTGGVGMNAVQGARYAGAKNVVAVDPNESKLERAKQFGATHLVADPAKVRELVVELTRGQLADHALMTVGVMNAEVARIAFDLLGKGGEMTITGIGSYDLNLPGNWFPGWGRRVQGSLFGGANPQYDVPRLLELWRAGDVKLGELITRRYALDEINDAYHDLLDGKNLRGVMLHTH